MLVACSELRLYGAGDLQVARRMRAMIRRIMRVVPEVRRPALEHELALMDRADEKSYAVPEDLALAQVPDTHGLGGAHPT